MEQWNTRVKTSVAYLKAGELRQIISGLKVNEYSPIIQDYLDRAELVANSTIERLDNNDVRLINMNALANLGNNLTNAVTHLNDWINGQVETSLTSLMDAELDAAVVQLVSVAPTLDVPEAREAITSLRRSVASHRVAVDKLIDEVKAKGSVADASIDEKVVAANADFLKIEAQVTDLNTGLVTIRTASASVSTEQQTAFTKAEADRSTKFNELLTSQQKELGTALATLEEQTTASAEEILIKVSAEETKAGEARKRVEEIEGMIGEKALIGDYSKNAATERKTADYWRYGAVVSILAAIVIASRFAINVSSETTWQFVVAKTLIVLSLGGLAGYAGRQSSEHRTAQRNAERMALQLKAIKPYLLDMDDKIERDKLLVSIADKLFGNSQQPITAGKKGDNPVVTAQLLEALLEVIKHSKGL